ncbi:Gp15 family bacteriophage protein [Lacticaseibacillus saniviri]|uniref:Gp15 family bacteriophage protein n=1 Tax=Lacticaseibacillus saniviri TaxID=931533 RepID=UPI001EDF7A91|nr:Gp15 family bacteriophage protein [Lacticaseibacillus saniviri]MCG4280859.1 bacteriophage Gp15 family protein [Lacticaseibacillus saniviri]
MLKIYEQIDDAVKVGDKVLQLDMAFNVILVAIDMLSDKDLTELEKIEGLITIVVANPPALTLEEKILAASKIVSDHINLNPIKRIEYDLDGNPMPTKKIDGDDQVMSLKFDGNLIYASFRQAYGIDLFDEQGKLHWAKFSALLNGLPEDTAMRQVMTIRGKKIDKHMSSDEKQEIKKLQEYWRIPEEEVIEDGS